MNTPNEANAATNEYILLPERGVRAEWGQPLFVGAMAARSTAPALTVTFGWRPGGSLREGFSFAFEPTGLPPDYSVVSMNVIDSIHEDSPKLVHVSDETALALRAQSPVVRLVPVRDYSTMDVRGYSQMDFEASLPLQLPPNALNTPSMTVQVESANGGSPVAGAEVVALTDARLRLGDRGLTDGHGRVSLRLATGTIEELYVDPPPAGYWGAFQRGIPISISHRASLEPVDLSFARTKDALRHFYGTSPPGGDGNGVHVAVIDTGIDAGHPDFGAYSGENTVTGEPAADYGDNGLGHGTHVAGIIAAQGTAPTGISGLAPAIDLLNFRVYGAGQRTAKNYAITKALIYACDRDCHLINLSLGSVTPDEALRDALEDARDHGALVMCAAGNSARMPVGVPACYGLAVAALGRQGTFPSGAREGADVAAPAGTDPDDFVPGFSNFGVDVDYIAPGVGIVSTVPGGHAPRRGTSMAAAAATGMAARLLSTQPALLKMPADRTRAAAMQNYLNGCARSMGFGLQFEGYGML